MKTVMATIVAAVIVSNTSAAYASNCAAGGELYARADVNGDGVITKTEVEDMRNMVFSRLDRNGDGVAEPSDAPRRFSGRYMEKFEPLLAQFDGNGDGRLEKSEFLDAPMTGFDGADQDGDGRLTKSELASRSDRTC